ncbi:MAG: complex I NDUFA9 subunit family protein [Burkholderiales bacterium]
MVIRKVCVFGGSGFVGSAIVQMLAARQTIVRVPTRDRERVKRLIVLPTVDVVTTDVRDPTELDRLTAGMDAVINLIGVLHEKKRGAFDSIHVELPGKIIAACRKNKVKRLLHMSALNARPSGPSAYLRSKGRGESEVMVAGEDLAATIFRPSVIFGRGDSFLNLFTKLVKFFPVIFLGSPNARFAPIHVEDVARAFVSSLDDASTFGRSYNLCGPKIYTLRELVEFVAAATGKKRRIVGFGDGFSYLQAWFLEYSPIKLLTRDNFYSMKMDSVCDSPFPFAFTPASIEEIVPAYLAPDSSTAP